MGECPSILALLVIPFSAASLVIGQVGLASAPLCWSFCPGRVNHTLLLAVSLDSCRGGAEALGCCFTKNVLGRTGRLTFAHGSVIETRTQARARIPAVQ